MARTALTGVKLQNNGTPLTTGAFSTLNLTGTVSASDAGSSVATVVGAASGAGTNVATEVLTPTQSGANITLDLTTLAHTFVAVEVVFRNGQALKPTTYWTISGSTITVLNADTSENYMVQYTY